MKLPVWTRPIAEFEPGKILCCQCGHTPEDAWETDPDGFSSVDGQIYCEGWREDLEEFKNHD